MFKLSNCFIALLFLPSCANIVTPSGGPKDRTPPAVIKSLPENYSTRFNADVVKITFDEFIRLQDLRNQLIISPPIEHPPDIRIKGKTVTIKFEEKLFEKTTYTINFGDAIRDITESNPIENYQYVFSTGDFLDSLSINGKVENAFDLKTEKGILVMLYSCSNNECDSLPYKELPNYFAKTDPSGKFKINNIKEGKYAIFALKDENRNYLYDLPNEQIAFLNNTIDPADSSEILLSLFEERKSKQRLKKAYAEQYGKLTFIFNEPTNNVHIRPLNFSSKKPWEIVDFTKNKDTLYYWTTLGIDTFVLEVSDNNPRFSQPIFSDTVKIVPVTKKENLKLGVKTNVNAAKSFDIYKDIQLVFSHPISNYDFSDVIITKRVDTIRVDTIKYKVIFDDKALRRFQIKHPWEGSGNYQLFISQGAFKDIFNLTNDSLRIDFRIRSLKYYGAIKLNLNNLDNDYNHIVQLLDSKENLIEEDIIIGVKDTISVSSMPVLSHSIIYKYLNPKKYRVKMIYDINDNGKWDTGNYIEKLQPEKIIYYPDPITIRSNWDIELKWKLQINE